MSHMDDGRLLVFLEKNGGWAPLLANKGSIVVTEATWLVDEPPAEAHAYWSAAYPAMATIDSLAVAGKEIAIDEAAGPVRLTLLGVPTEGVEVSIRTVGRQPMAIGALDASFGLPEMEQALTPMPAHLLPSPATWTSGMTRVYRSAWF